MFKWKKLGKIFDPTVTSGGGWMREYAQSPSVLQFEDRVRVYFSCRPLPDAAGKYVSYLGYVDLDREDLTRVLDISRRPILALGELGTFDEFGTNPACVIRVGGDTRLYYCGWTRCESVPFNSAIGVAQSYDGGKTFVKLGKGPVLSYSSEEPFLLGSPKVRYFNNTWYLWYASGSHWLENNGRPEPVYKIRMAHSTDGINWIKEGRNLIDVKLEENECQASADVLYYKNKFHMFFSYRYSVDYRMKEAGYRIGYASSDDMRNWKRDDSKVGISLSDNGWDSEMISYSYTFILNDRLHMLYQGNNFGKLGIGLAILEY